MPGKGSTPSKSSCRAPDFQRTPRPLPRRSLCGGSPLFLEHAPSPHAGSPLAAKLPWATSPCLPPCTPLLPKGALGGALASPLPGLPSWPSPTCAAAAASQRLAAVLPPPCPTTPAAAAAPVLSTPSKIIAISTPCRPCARRRVEEAMDELKVALEEQSSPLLKVVLQRRHACPGEHALHEAVRQGQLQAVRMLLAGRAEPNARCLCLERGCELPLQLAVQCTSFQKGSDRHAAVELLLEARAEPNVRRGDAEANAPLHDAARRADLDLVGLLLRYGADPNLANGFGEQPLTLALRSGGFAPEAASLGTVEELLRAGACPFAEVAKGLESPDVKELLAKWSSWWRLRTLAWAHSRGKDELLTRLFPELLMRVAKFL